MKKTIILFISAMVICTLSSCEKYLQVEPKSTIAEDELFESETGFKQAMSGIYAQLTSRALYGDNLTMGFVSALAQDYNVEGSDAPLVATRHMDYTSEEVIKITGAIWQNSYKAIAGINKILDNAERRKAMLGTQSYALIRGEGLALRSYLHFDLLRIFAPSKELAKSKKVIPFKTTTNQNTVAPSTFDDLITFILSDLNEAAQLMKDFDPVRKGDDNRRIKLNYYGVKALIARIKLYSGDYKGAYEAAKEVVESNRYPFVEERALTTSDGFKDRLYQSELIFCLRVNDMQNWVDKEYFRGGGAATMRLSQTIANFNLLYETEEGGSTDFRKAHGVEQDGRTWFTSKYWQTYEYKDNDPSRLDRMVPLIRYTEMFYIMAETTTSLTERISLINQVRVHRGLIELPTDLSEDEVDLEILKEHLKEFYAEGQHFFYYKRKNAPGMLFLDDEMPLEKYTLPIPALEVEFNPNYN